MTDCDRMATVRVGHSVEVEGDFPRIRIVVGTAPVRHLSLELEEVRKHGLDGVVLEAPVVRDEERVYVGGETRRKAAVFGRSVRRRYGARFTL